MFVVRTDSQKRRKRWLQLFGVEQLPVKRPFARPLLVGNEEELAFELDAGRLPSMSAYRFAGVVARELRLSYREACGNELDCWPIPAGGLIVMRAAVKRPFFYLWRFVYSFWARVVGAGQNVGNCWYFGQAT